MVLTTPTVLALPGLLCDEFVWERQIAALGDEAHLVVPVYGSAERRHRGGGAERYGQGVDIAFDAGGHADTIQLALASVRPKGRVINIALWEHPVEFDMFSMLFKESNLTASYAYCNDHGEVIAALASGAIDVTPLISARIPLEEIVSGGIEELMNNRDAHVKILVHP